MSSPSDAAPVEAQLELTEVDFLHALRSMPERRFGIASVSVIAALVVAGMGMVQGFDLAIWLTIAFVAVLLVVMHFTTTRLQARRFFAEIAPERRKTTYIFTPTSVEISSKSSHARQDYEALKRYVLTPHTLLLYSSSSIAQVIPLRAFAPNDRERVIAWVKAHVKPSPRVPSVLGRTVVMWLVLVVAFAMIWWLFAP